MEISNSSYIGHEPCPNCRNKGKDIKGNNLARYSDGHGYCFSCGYYENATGDEKIEKEYKSVALIDGEIKALSKRGISEKTCAFFNYRVGTYKDKKVQIAPYYSKDGKLTAQHLRFMGKEFKWAGDFKKSGLFGQQLWRDSGGKRLIITEGEIDAMTISQLQDNKFPVVSLRSGAMGAVNDIKENLEWLETFETVIFAFDMDEVGREAANKCALLLQPNKAKIAWLPAKDANECLAKGKVTELINALWEAKSYRPDDIVTGAEIKTLCETVPEKGLDISYAKLNEKIMGIRTGEILLFTAGSGIGKTTFVHEILYEIHQRYNVPVGLICLEENISKTGRKWIGMHINKNLNRYGAQYTKEEFDTAFNETIGRGDWYAYNHFGSIDIDTILSKIRYMAVGLDIKYIMLDHISIVVSGLTDGDERKTIDVFMTKLRSLVDETNITILAVVHLKRPEKGKSWNEGRNVTLTDLRGSGGLEQLSDIVIALERNQQGKNPNVSNIRIVKNRESGICGSAGAVEYKPETDRLLPCNSPEEEASDFDFKEEGETNVR